MANILDRIVERKRVEVAECKRIFPAELLERSPFFNRKPFSMVSSLRASGKSGIIAEIKRKSPSRGIINPNVSIEDIAAGYQHAGVSAISVLTDREFFGGSNDDLTTARNRSQCPILRKEFIIDPYQVLEAKSIGADAILLIAAILDPGQLKSLTGFAHSLGMEVLLEVHEMGELDKSIAAKPDLMGVNNRDLKTFNLSVDVSRKLAAMIPSEITKVSESGIESPDVIIELKQLGYEGFLIGQTFMQEKSPGLAAKEFIRTLKKKEAKKG